MHGTWVWLVVMVGVGLRMLLVAPKVGPPATAPPVCEAGLAIVELRGRGVACLAGATAGDVVAQKPARCQPRMRTARLEALGVVLDPNHAGIRELTSLPGIGPRLAEAIVAGRPFANVDAVARVKGLGPSRWGRVRLRLAVASRPLVK